MSKTLLVFLAVASIFTFVNADETETETEVPHLTTETFDQ